MIRFIKVNAPVTIQDVGRLGHQSAGVPIGGPMDDQAMHHANVVVGNAMDAATIEIGPGIVEIEIENELIALSGFGHTALLDNEVLEFNRPVFISDKAKIKFKSKSKGNWTYLSLAGGINVPLILGSRSTYVPASIGGYHGRLLKANDKLSCYEPSSTALNIIRGIQPTNSSYASAKWFTSIKRDNDNTIRFTAGPEWHGLSMGMQKKLGNASFNISNEINRMGYRLSGEKITLKQKREMISSGVSRGTIQLTHEGQLIVLMADSQTIGGYPRIAQVSTVDIGKLAQMAVGEELKFELISNATSEEVLLNRENEFRKIQMSVRLRFV